MITKEINLYEFDELTDKVKEKVRENMNDIVNMDWHDFVECDFIENNKENGYDIKHIYFDIGRGNYAIFEADFDIEKFCNSQEVKITPKIQKMIDEGVVITKISCYYGSMSIEYEGDENTETEKLLAKIREFTDELASNLMTNLKDEWDNVNSDEYIDEFIKSNEYTFRENGEMESVE